MTAADWSAVAEWVIAGSVILHGVLLLWQQREAMDGWLERWREMARSVLTSEIGASPAWQAVSRTPEVSLESGVAFARTTVRTGHPPHAATQGRPSPEQPLDCLLTKTAETVWNAVESARSELAPYLPPLRNYLTALAAKAGLSPARDFALGVLTERVRQEENGWPDSPGEGVRAGLRSAHGTGGHSCVLERKHQVEQAIYAAPTTAPEVT